MTSADAHSLRWGAAFPAVQSEGAALGSDWFAWERADEVPPSFEGNEFARHFAADFELLASVGADLVRITLDWARIEPEEGKIDVAVLERYRNVLVAAKEAGLEPWVVLVDGPAPGWFSIDERGWRDRRARQYFWPRHVERIADHVGDLVPAWVPILRPVSFARGSFITAAAPPGTRSVQRFVETVQGCYLASLGAWEVLRGSGAPVALGVESAPVRVGEDGGERPTRLYDELQWAWTEGMRDGELSLPRMPIVRVDAMRDAFDAVAMTFDGGYQVGRDGRVARFTQDEELLGSLHRLAESAGDRPLWIAGQTVSVGDPAADIEPTERALQDIDSALHDGIDLRAWFWEPAIDGYQGASGFDTPMGLFDRDRVPKPACEAISRWQASHRVAMAEPVPDPEDQDR
ncbi:MAG: family 1 glycosylhydrolase [Acidimicrobiales bacterium]